MATEKKTSSSDSSVARYLIVGLLLVAAFFGAYKYAQAGSVSAQAGSLSASGAPSSTSGAAADGSCCGGSGASGSTTGGSAASAAGGCCGSGGPASKPVAGTATLSGGVQKIDVKVTTSYSPNVIHLKAGVPAEIIFSQAQGCTAIVQSQDLGFQEDLSAGPKTVKLQGLSAGTYKFACGMNMVQGQVVVQ
jgi:hypothetical protein